MNQRPDNLIPRKPRSAHGAVLWLASRVKELERLTIVQGEKMADMAAKLAKASEKK